MDVEMVRKLVREKSLEELQKYLAVYDSDAEKIQGMSGAEMLRYMASRPRPQVPWLDEYAEACKIVEYNLSPGKLTGYDCPICRNKGNLIGIDDAGKQVLWLCSCREKRQIIRNAHSSNLGELLQKLGGAGAVGLDEDGGDGDGV